MPSLHEGHQNCIRLGMSRMQLPKLSFAALLHDAQCARSSRAVMTMPFDSQCRRLKPLPCLSAGAVPRAASRLGSVVLDQPNFPVEDYEEETEQRAVEFEHGFSLEYVIQIVRPGQGPHVMEVHLKGAQLQWPYVTQMDFVWDLANAYKHYFVQDWVLPFPQVFPLPHSPHPWYHGGWACQQGTSERTP